MDGELDIDNKDIKGSIDDVLQKMYSNDTPCLILLHV